MSFWFTTLETAATETPAFCATSLMVMAISSRSLIEVYVAQYTTVGVLRSFGILQKGHFGHLIPLSQLHHDVHAFCDLAKNRVASVQSWGICQTNIELGRGRIRILRTGHTKGPRNVFMPADLQWDVLARAAR